MLLQAAQRREALLDEAGSAALVQRAFRADPDYLPAEYAALSVLADRMSISGRLRILTGTPGISPADSGCLALDLTAAPGREIQDLAALDHLERRSGNSACTGMLRVLWQSNLPRDARPPDLLTAAWPRVVASAPSIGQLWYGYATALLDAGQPAAAEKVATQGMAHDIGVPGRYQLYDLIAAAWLARGDSADAAAALRDRADWVRANGTPEARFADLSEEWSGDPARVRLTPFRREAAMLAELHAGYHLAGEWLGLADRLLNSGSPRSAQDAYGRGLVLADSLGAQPLRVRALVGLGRAELKVGRWQAAVHALQRAAAICDPLDLAYHAYIHHNLAHAYETGGRWNEAVAEADRFVMVADSMPRDALHMISLYDDGVIQWEAGQHAAARRAFNAMVAVIDSIHQNYFYAGDYYERVGDLSRALEYYRKVPRADLEEGARALSGLARVFDLLGMPDSAEAAAREHDRDVQTPEEVPLLPSVLAAHGHVAQALAIAQAWADTQTARGNLRGVTLSELQLAGLLLDAGAVTHGLDQARRAEALAARANFPADHARAMTLVARGELLLGWVGNAVRDAQAAQRAAADQGTEADRRDADLVLGDARAASGNRAAALAAYGAAADAVESLGRSVTADLSRASFQARQLDVFDRAVRLLLAMPPSPARTAALFAWSQRRTVAAFPTAASHGAPLTLRETQARLGAHRALVDYVLLDSTAAAVVVTPSRADVVPLDAPAGRIDSLVGAVRAPFTAEYMGRVDLDRVLPNGEAAGELSAALMRPIASLLRGANRLAIVPDGALYLLPFDLLPLDDSGLVVDRFAVSLLPAVRFLAGASQVRLSGARASLLLVGSDAPGAAREVNAVRSLWTAGPVRVLTSRAATETAIRAALPRYAVIHFSTHAIVDAGDPLSSRLLLAPDSMADGLFHVSEIEQTPSRARLVVLSACESENGQSFAGAGPMGLARAFLVGGAKAVVATQWPIAATAADVMRDFYERMAAGNPPDVALREAKAAARRDPRTANPFNWAGFVLFGDAPFRFVPVGSAGSPAHRLTASIAFTASPQSLVPLSSPIRASAVSRGMPGR